MLAPLPILVAAIATIPVGFVWYSPLLFVKPWIHFNGLNPKKMKAPVMAFLSTFLTSLVMAALIALLINMLKITALPQAWKLGTLLWFGFNFMPGLTQSLFSKRPIELLLIDSGHQAANVIVMTWVLVSWK